ncbi:MAG: cytochrome c peroxidase [Coriobacteriia bacterium]
MRRRVIVFAVVFVVFAVGLAASAAAAPTLTAKEALGKALFFDEALSLNGNQSCASCHAPEVGWVGPNPVVNAHGSVYEGSIPGAFGDRKPPTAAYGGNSPLLYWDAKGGVWVGGMFWDGRATGWVLGDPLAEQALGPFLNPKEQALPSAEAVVAVVAASDYADEFQAVWGSGIWDSTTEAYAAVGFSIAAYERSAEVMPYSSKYDAYLAKQVKLSKQEKAGMNIFFGKGKCGRCHNGPDFTDFTYDNLGVPKNLENPATVADPTWIDPGLGGYLMSAGYDEAVYAPEWGKHKVPTLRNVDLRVAEGDVKAYGHNGYFKSLEEIVHFYNTRDVVGAGWMDEPWPAPEYAATVNTAELGDLKLKPDEEAALVAFLKTLSDGYVQ